MRVLTLLNPFRWRRSARSTDPRYDDILATLADTLRQPVQGVSYTSRDPWDYPEPSYGQEDGIEKVSTGHVCQECERRKELARLRKERFRKRERDIKKRYRPGT